MLEASLRWERNKNYVISGAFYSSSIYYFSCVYPVCHQESDGIRPGHITNPSQGDRETKKTQSPTLTITPMDTSQPYVHVFGLLEDPHRNGENMQTPYRKTSLRTLNCKCLCSEVTKITVTLLPSKQREENQSIYHCCCLSLCHTSQLHNHHIQKSTIAPLWCPSVVINSNSV